MNLIYIDNIYILHILSWVNTFDGVHRMFLIPFLTLRYPRNKDENGMMSWKLIRFLFSINWLGISSWCTCKQKSSNSSIQGRNLLPPEHWKPQTREERILHYFFHESLHSVLFIYLFFSLYTYWSCSNNSKHTLLSSIP